MATRTLNLAAALAWLLACVMLCVLAFDPMRSEAARVAVVVCAVLDITVAFGLMVAVHLRIRLLEVMLATTEQVLEAVGESLDATLQVARETNSVLAGRP